MKRSIVQLLDSRGRFPEMEEDEPLLHLLVTDYTCYFTGGEGRDR